MVRRSYRLRIRALVALVGFLCLVAAFAALQWRAMAVAEGNHRVLGELRLLASALPALNASVRNYDEHAPRDYPSYDRDVVIFLHELRLRLDQLATELTALEAAFEERIGVAVPLAMQRLLGGGVSYDALAASVTEARRAWDAFDDGLREKLGPDEEEPRLEWGAEFVAAELPAVYATLMALGERFRAFLDEQARWTVHLVQVALAVLLLVGALGIVWFYRRVVDRIGRAAAGCARVANGDFGYTLPIDGQDEIGELARAFNSLSNRSEMVVRMLGSLQQAASPDAALAAVVSASGIYLPVAWAGMLVVDRHAGRMHLVRALPQASLGSWPDRELAQGEAFGDELSRALVARRPVIVNELRERAAAPGEHFLFNLVRATQLEALAALPLASAGGWEGVLLFGSRTARYASHQVDLLNSLAPTLASSFQRTAAARAA